MAVSFREWDAEFASPLDTAVKGKSGEAGVFARAAFAAVEKVKAKSQDESCGILQAFTRTSCPDNCKRQS